MIYFWIVWIIEGLWIFILYIVKHVLLAWQNTAYWIQFWSQNSASEQRPAYRFFPSLFTCSLTFKRMNKLFFFTVSVQHLQVISSNPTCSPPASLSIPQHTNLPQRTVSCLLLQEITQWLQGQAPPLKRQRMWNRRGDDVSSKQKSRNHFIFNSSWSAAGRKTNIPTSPKMYKLLKLKRKKSAALSHNLQGLLHSLSLAF